MSADPTVPESDYVEALGAMIAAAVWIEQGNDPVEAAQQLRAFWESKVWPREESRA